MGKEYNYERWYEDMLELSENYSYLKGVVAILMIAYPLSYTGLPVTEILKVEDDLIQRGIIPRRVEYEDKMNGFIYEGEEIIKDIKDYLWLVLYEERSIKEYEERLGKNK